MLCQTWLFQIPLVFKLKTITSWICPHSFAMGHLELLFKSIFFCFPWMFEIHVATSVQLYFNFLWLSFTHIKFPWLRIKFPDFFLTVTWPVATLEIQTPYFITLVLTHMVKKVSSDISMCIPNLVSTSSLLTRWAEITLVCGFLCFVFFCKWPDQHVQILLGEKVGAKRFIGWMGGR